MLNKFKLGKKQDSSGKDFVLFQTRQNYINVENILFWWIQENKFLFLSADSDSDNDAKISVVRINSNPTGESHDNDVENIIQSMDPESIPSVLRYQEEIIEREK